MRARQAAPSVPIKPTLPREFIPPDNSPGPGGRGWGLGLGSRAAAPQVCPGDTSGNETQAPPIAAAPPPLTPRAQAQPLGPAALWGDSAAATGRSVSACSPLTQTGHGRFSWVPPAVWSGSGRALEKQTLQTHHFPRAAPPLTPFRFPRATVEAAADGVRGLNWDQRHVPGRVDRVPACLISPTTHPCSFYARLSLLLTTNRAIST